MTVWKEPSNYLVDTPNLTARKRGLFHSLLIKRGANSPTLCQDQRGTRLFSSAATSQKIGYSIAGLLPRGRYPDMQSCLGRTRVPDLLYTASQSVQD